MEATSNPLALALTQIDQAVAPATVTLKAMGGDFEREVDSVELDSFRIWDLCPATGQRITGTLRLPGEAPVALRGQVIFAGRSGGRTFATVTFRPESWDGFLALVRHGTRRRGGIASLLAA